MPFSLPEDFEPHHSSTIVPGGGTNTVELAHRVAEIFGLQPAATQAPYVALRNALSHLPDAPEPALSQLKKIATQYISRTRDDAASRVETALLHLRDKAGHDTSLMAVEIFAVCIKGALDANGISPKDAVKAPLNKHLKALASRLDPELFAILHAENLRAPESPFKKLLQHALFVCHLPGKQGNMPQPKPKWVKDPSLHERELNAVAKTLNLAYRKFGTPVDREEAYDIFCKAAGIEPTDKHHRVGRLLHEHTGLRLKGHIDRFQEKGTHLLSAKELESLAIREKGRVFIISSRLIESICVHIIAKKNPELTEEGGQAALQPLRQKLLGFGRAPGE